MTDLTAQPANELLNFDDDDVTIRPLQLEDLAPVFALGEEIFSADKWPNLYRTWDQYELASLYVSDNDFCFVAEINEKVVGFAFGTVIEKRHSAWQYGYLLWLGVDPTAKKRGVGAQLVNAITKAFIHHGARMMMVDTAADNATAIRFFKSQGFGHDTPHVYFSRNLTTHPEYKRMKREKKQRKKEKKERRERKLREKLAKKQAKAAALTHPSTE